MGGEIRPDAPSTTPYVAPTPAPVAVQPVDPVQTQGPIDHVANGGESNPARRELQPRRAPHTFNGIGAPRPNDRNDPTSNHHTPADLRTFDATVRRIHQHPRYQALDADAKREVDESLTIARTRSNPNYYSNKMMLLFRTPEAPPAQTATSMRAEQNASANEAAQTQSTPQGQADMQNEERATRAWNRNWTTVRGDDATYRVDRSDPNNVVVHMKVALSGNDADVAQIKALEDQIEKKGSTRGYTLDIEFVDRCAPDVFQATVDPTRWTDSGNWVGDAEGIAHEAHHRLGLDDRYDYIEAHANNRDMSIPDRVHWFREQMNKPPDPAGRNSLMGDGHQLLNDDVCRVAQDPNPTACIGARVLNGTR
jgi:hypothetical protein